MLCVTCRQMAYDKTCSHAWQRASSVKTTRAEPVLDTVHCFYHSARVFLNLTDQDVISLL